MLSKTLVLLCLAGVCLGDGIITTNGNNQGFLGITKLKCFGAVVAEDSSATAQSEFDVCLAGIVGGAIILIALYPTLLSNGASVIEPPFRRRNDIYPAEFVNPAERIEQQQAPKLSLKDRLSRTFDSIKERFDSFRTVRQPVHTKHVEYEEFVQQVQEKQDAPQAAPVATEKQES